MAWLNWFAIIICTICMFIGGAVWHGPLMFGKIWMRIHHGDAKFSDEEMKKMTKWMWKLMLAEFVADLLMVIGLACIILALPAFGGVRAGLMVWVSFVLPTMISVVLWGNDPKKWMSSKIAISSSYRLIALMLIGYVLSIW